MPRKPKNVNNGASAEGIRVLRELFTTVMRRTISRSSYIVTSLSLVALLAGAFMSPSLAQVPELSPEGQLLVVTTNLQEAWQEEANNNSEMDNYVSRLLDQVPYRPDILLLQEVKLKSARYVKNLLTTQTGDTYAFGWKPPRQPWTQNPKRRWEMDNGILINTETVRKLDTGGWIDLTYERKHAVDKVERVETTRHARVSVQERAGGLKLASASVHLQYGHLIERFDTLYQNRWTDKLASTMAAKYPNAVRVIAGDFNKDRCVGESDVRSCSKAPFWDNLTSADYAYDDALYRAFRNGKEGVGLGGVDFIFTTGRVEDAGSDTSYDKSNNATFYSDHRFFWALIGSTPAP